MFNKKISLAFIVLVFMLSISAVSAADTNSSDDMIASNLDEEPPSEASDSMSVDNLAATNQDDYILKGSDLYMYEKDGSSFDVTLKKGTSPVKGASIIFSINGKNYTRNTDNSGIASLSIGLAAGNFSITSHYGKLSTSNKIIVSPVIIANDVNMYYGSGNSFCARFLNTNGKVLVNTNVVFNINGKDYTKKTNTNGLASLPIGLNPGSYVIYSIHPNGAKKSNILNVVSAIKANNVNAFYNGGTVFSSQFFNVRGKALGNTNIIFNINGKNYTKKTNSRGVASFTINFKVGNYVVTSIHPKGYQLSNTIRVVNAVKANDLTMYYNSGSSFTAKFFNVDGTALANKNVVFKLNGNEYIKKTDSAGVASLPIGLNAGKFVVYSIHPSGVKTSNNIVVKSTVASSDLTKHYSSSKHFTATFYTNTGKALANKNIKFTKKTSSGQTTDFTVTTDSNGKATLKVISEPNKFSIISYNTETGEKVTNSVEILPTVIAESMTVFSEVTSKFKVTLYNGESLAANTKMNIYVDGSKKTVTTNSNGVASLSFKLDEGTHVFKSVDPFTGYTASTKVYVISPTIIAKDITAKANENTKFRAILLDGNGEKLPNTDMKISVNKVTKTVKTNANGVASYTFNLPEGVYSVVCKDLSNGCTLTRTITVTTDGNVIYNQYGVSSDGRTILAIGRSSSAGEYANYGYSFYKTVLERKCPCCGSTELYWSIFFAGNEYDNYGVFPATGYKEGSSAEGLIVCAHCDSDWSVFGHNHGGVYDLVTLVNPVKTTKADAYSLLEGNYVY